MQEPGQSANTNSPGGEAGAPSAPAAKPCRHEYVKIYQRRLKGLDRRLVSTRAYLPTGFKLGDFGHLSEGSYCFCTKCRTRLFPKRTNADRAQARLAALAGKQAEAELGLESNLELEKFLESDLESDQEGAEVQLKDGQDVQIEELVTESADIEASDIEEDSDVQEEED